MFLGPSPPRFSRHVNPSFIFKTQPRRRPDSHRQRHLPCELRLRWCTRVPPELCARGRMWISRQSARAVEVTRPAGEVPSLELDRIAGSSEVQAKYAFKSRQGGSSGLDAVVVARSGSEG